LAGQTLGDRGQLKKGRGVWGMPHIGKGHHGFAWGRRIGLEVSHGDGSQALVHEESSGQRRAAGVARQADAGRSGEC
jgi:hypothetical protein